MARGTVSRFARVGCRLLGLVAVAGLIVPASASASASAETRYDPVFKVARGVFLAKVPKKGKATNRSARRPAKLAGPKKRARPRIVGGDPTTIAEWPWQAAVTLNPAIYSGDPFQRQFCGATLVTPSILVTAAHCVYDDSTGTFFPVSDHASVTGRTTLTTTAEGQEIPWSNYFVFVDGSGTPMYNGDVAGGWDVVFAQLASPSPSFNSTPIMIAGANEAGSWAPGDENAWATGWGTTSFMGAKSPALREVHIDMIADSTCASGTFYGATFDPETMVCAGEAAGGQDTCQGDSGGPLVVPVGGAFRLVGDTSFGFGCALATKPGIYGRVAQNPMCGALQTGIQQVAGVDVVGSGGCLAGNGAPAGCAQPVGSVGSSCDATPPNGFISKAPKRKTKKKRTKIEFGADEPATFDCVLDGKEQFKACTSPMTIRVKKGRHTFEVTATDAAGNADPSPETAKWKVKKKKRKKR
jgi:Trypsin